MNKNTLLKTSLISTLLVSLSAFSANSNKPDDFSATSDAHAEKRINKTLDQFKAERKTVEKNLRNFDDLDLNIYSHQKWDEMHKSHAENIIVNYPDGTKTYGLKDHVDRIKQIFVFAPDTETPTHHVRIGQDNYTAVTGVWRGTFTKPMVLADGTVIQPNGKKFQLEMATVARWNDKGTMDEEWLFYDEYTFMKQLDLLK